MSVFQVMVTLVDAVNLYRDDPPQVPLITWMPYHYASVVSADFYLLRGVTAVASLAPTMALKIADQVNSLIPHGVPR